MTNYNARETTEIKHVSPTYKDLVSELDELQVMYDAKKEEAEHYKNLYINYVEESIYHRNSGQ